jgi:hypothetical protein
MEIFDADIVHFRGVRERLPLAFVYTQAQGALDL